MKNDRQMPMLAKRSDQKVKRETAGDKASTQKRSNSFEKKPPEANASTQKRSKSEKTPPEANASTQKRSKS